MSLQESLRTVFDELPDGVCATDKAGRIVYINPAAERLLGLPSRRAVGLSLCKALCARLSEPGHPDCAGDCPARARRAAPSERFNGVWRGERWGADEVRQTERSRDLRVRCLPLADSRGWRLTMIEDASAERELERQREDWRGMVAHDLRAPLANIFGALRTIQEGVTPDQARELGALGVRNVRRMMELLDLYLEVSKLEAGKMPVESRPVELAAALAEGARELSALAREKGVRVAVAASPAVALADESLLARIVQNLLHNALKFSPPGSEVTLSAARAGEGRVALEVSDQGPGIPADELPRLFDRYHQAAARRKDRREGTGLGLAFCRRAAEAMGGAISVRSTPGEGAAFYLELPAAPAPGGASAPASRAARSARP